MSEQPQPQLITLDAKNSIEILTQFVEVAQKHGAFLLAESDILKRAKDVLLRGVQDPEINDTSARNLFIQAVNKGQQKGAYTLDDASILHKVCQFIAQSSQQSQQVQSQQVQSTVEDDDLDSLSAPVPLRTQPKIV